MVIVDDGSTDTTLSVVRDTANSWSGRLDVLTIEDHGYDIRRVPANINLSHAYVEKNQLKFDYWMLTNDDCFYDSHYCERLFSKFSDNSLLAVCSGRWKAPGRLGISNPQKEPPQGSGRIIRNDFWKQVGSRYPLAYGWEPWIVFKALQMGYQVASYPDAPYNHVRPLGKAHGSKHWGIEMRALGYHPLIALARFTRNLLFGTEPLSPKANFLIMLYYFLPVIYRNDPFFKYFDIDLRRFVRALQINSIATRPELGKFRPLLIGMSKAFGALYPLPH